MTWFSPKPNKKRDLTIAMSLLKRDIFFVPLEEYEVACPNCHVVNHRKIKCKECGTVINTDRTLKGNRPVIIVSSPIMNLESRDAAMVLVIPITKNDANYPDSVVIPADNITGLDLPSRAHVFALTSCDRNWFFEEKKIGRVGESEWNQIESKLKELIGTDSNRILIGNTVLTSTDIKEILEYRKQCKADIVKLSGEKLDMATRLEKQRETYEGKLNSQRKYNEALIKNNKQLETNLKTAKAELEEIKEKINPKVHNEP